MNENKEISPTNDECDKLAKSIIDGMFIPINKETKKNTEIQTLFNVYNFMGIGLKNIMKDELVNNPLEFLNNIEIKQLNQDIKNDILNFSKCHQYFNGLKRNTK